MNGILLRGIEVRRLQHPAVERDAVADVAPEELDRRGTTGASVARSARRVGERAGPVAGQLDDVDRRRHVERDQVWNAIRPPGDRRTVRAGLIGRRHSLRRALAVESGAVQVALVGLSGEAVK